MTSTIIYLLGLGGKFNLFNLLLLGLLCFIICIALKNRILRLSIAFILALFCGLQLLSLYFNHTFIGYQFYIHTNVRDTSLMIGLYTKELLLLSALVLSITYVFFKSRTLFLSYYKQINLKVLYISLCTTVLFSLVVMSSSGGPIFTAYETLKMFKSTSTHFDNALHNLDIKAYTSPKKLKGTAGKNIIIISLESLESAFLSDTFKHLTPNLRRLKQDWQHFNIKQNKGSEWTAGSLYTVQTGFPAFFGIEGNSIFKQVYQPKISSITQTLNAANYQTQFYIGDSNFAGTKELMYNFEIDGIYDRYILKNKGHDLDIFKAAKQQLLQQKDGLPYALFISTTDSHFPDGIYDERMEDFVTPQKSNLEFSIAAIDYLIGDFIQFLNTENMINNTAIFIFPDHLKMGSKAIFKGIDNRDLYLLTNSTNLTTYKDQDLYQIDLPKLILEGANIKHNQKFLTDYIVGNKQKYIGDNLYDLTTLNISAWTNTQSTQYQVLNQSTNYEYYKQDVSRFIAHAGGAINNHIYTNSLEALNHNYDLGFRYFELDIIQTSDGKYVAAHDWKHWKKITAYSGDTPVDHNTFMNQKIHGQYHPIDMSVINSWFEAHPDAVLVTDKINSPKAFSAQFSFKSRLMMELFTIDAINEAQNLELKSIIASQAVLKEIDGNLKTNLKNLNIKNIAVSLNYLNKHSEVIKELQEVGIKTFVYGLNFKKAFNEQYMTKYKMDTIYGIYADRWKFN